MQRFERDVQVIAGDVKLPGRLLLPQDDLIGVIIFAHGSGSSRLSARNLAVAGSLVDFGCATLLFDLLTEDEAFDRRNTFDIALLGTRMVDVTRWVQRRDEFHNVPIAYFGASTGAAAAIVAAASVRGEIDAVVSRGGRPDLAGDALEQVDAPTLLMVGSRDTEVLELNEAAQGRMSCESELVVIPGATHLFEEPNTLEQVAHVAGKWFVAHFTTSNEASATRSNLRHP